MCKKVCGILIEFKLEILCFTQNYHIAMHFVVLESELALQGIGASAFIMTNAAGWTYMHCILWAIAELVALEILARLALLVGSTFSIAPIPPKGSPLLILTPKDMSFITFNKLTTTLFAYHFFRFTWHLCDWNSNVLTDIKFLPTFITTLAALYLTYDFTYTLFHRFLHHPSVYKYIHKHHHRQLVPSRGNVDATNVHPVEFIIGEYNHLLALYVVNLFYPIHAVPAIAFLVLGSIAASLNHTRYDVRIPYLYQVRYHDIHHWYPDANFGQYVLFWDYVFGSFKEYPKK